MSATFSSSLLEVPLGTLHRELGARMVPFAGYSMPVQYPSGLIAEHRHVRTAAGLFDVSHMGQLRLAGSHAAAALETLMPVDVIDLPPGRQRYGLLTNDAGGIIDDLMLVNRSDDFFLIVNGACKAADFAHIEQRIADRCSVQPLPELALLALQGPLAASVLRRLAPGVESLVFMTGGTFDLAGCGRCHVTRSGYTGEDGFEISVPAERAETLARRLLAQPEVAAIGLGARNSLRLEAGLCLYGSDIDATTTPVEAGLSWAIQKVRRSGGARAGSFPGATKILAQLEGGGSTPDRKRVGLMALQRIPVREHSELRSTAGERIGEVTSGLLSPTLDVPIAMGYVTARFALPGTTLAAMVRGNPVPMRVVNLPFVETSYFRGAPAAPSAT